MRKKQWQKHHKKENKPRRIEWRWICLCNKVVKISWPYRGSYSVKKNKTQSFDSPWFGFSLCFCRCLFLIVNFLSSPRFPKSSGVDPKKALAKTACDLAGEPNSVVQLEPACSIYVYVYTSKYIYICVCQYRCIAHNSTQQQYRSTRRFAPRAAYAVRYACSGKYKIFVKRTKNFERSMLDASANWRLESANLGAPPPCSRKTAHNRRHTHLLIVYLVPRPYSTSRYLVSCICIDIHVFLGACDYVRAQSFCR